MQNDYKVDYIESQILRKNDDWKRKGNVDGYFTSKDVEALIQERHKQGYELVSIVPLNGQVSMGAYSFTTTIGFMVTFKFEAKESAV